MKKVNWLLAAILAAVLFLSITGAAADFLLPPRTTYGVCWERYQREPKDSIDVLFYGSSHVYCNIVPSVIYEDSGITSYLVTGASQTMQLTWYYVRESLKTQSPKVVFVESSAMFYNRYEAFTESNIAYFPHTLNRLGATLEGAEPSLWPNLLLPILAYHSRWQEQPFSELEFHLNPGTDPLAGYTWLTNIFPVGEEAPAPKTAGEEDYQRCLEYLQKIAGLCADQGIPLVVFNAPSYNYLDPDDVARLQQDVENLPGDHMFIDFNQDRDAFGIDNATDWYDPLHLNCRGAEKFSRYLAGWLQENCGLSQTEGEVEELWQQRIQTFRSYRNTVV